MYVYIHYAIGTNYRHQLLNCLCCGKALGVHCALKVTAECFIREVATI